jgi:hypothetical protein
MKTMEEYTEKRAYFVELSMLQDKEMVVIFYSK